MKIFQIWSTAC